MNTRAMKRSVAFAVTLAFLLTTVALASGAASAQPLGPWDWQQVNDDGFGNLNNVIVFSMAVYNDRLYGGTWNNDDGASVWRYDGGTTWTQVMANGLGDVNNRGASAMRVFDGDLYVGLANNSSGGSIWRYDGGTSWTRVDSGIGDDCPGCLYEFGGDLYCGTAWSYAKVLRYDGGTTWTQVNDDGFGSSDNDRCRALCGFNGSLYAGTHNEDDGCEVWRYNGGTSWTQVNEEGFGYGSDFYEARSMAVWDGALYAGTADYCSLWRYSGSGTDWTEVGWDDLYGNDGVRVMVPFGEGLLLGTGNDGGGGEAWYLNQEGYARVNEPGFGDTNQSAVHDIAPFQGQVYASTANWYDGGGQVWAASFPVLSAVKSAPAVVPQGGEIPYTITIENTGSGTAAGVSFTDEIPKGTSVVPGSVTCSDAGATIAGEDPVTINNITVPAGSPVTITFSVTVDPGLPLGTVIANQGFVHFAGLSIPTGSPDDPEGPTDVVVISGKVPGSKSWYIAEGSTGGGFDSWVLLMNSNDAVAKVNVTFATDAGPQDAVAVEMAPGSRYTVRVADYVPDTWGVSTIVESDQPIVAERSMYWDKGLVGDSDEAGAPAPYEMRGGHSNLGVPMESVGKSAGGNAGSSNYFPEGSTAGGFDTWVLLVNPWAQDVVARVTLMTPEGEAAVDYLTVPSLSRRTVHLDEYLPDATEVSTEVYTNGTFPLIAERSTYWDPDEANLQPYEMIGGHSDSGSPAANTAWFLAEGSTGGGFETYVLVQNPNEEDAEVDLTFSDANGFLAVTTGKMKPRSRATFKVSDYAPGNFEVSTTVGSDIPVIAERSMYWDNRTASAPYEMRDGHSTVGTNNTGTWWVVPEGSTGVGFETFILVSNVWVEDVEALLVFSTQEGVRDVVEVTVPAGARYTARVSDYVPNEFQVSTLVVSATPLVVEHSMYWDMREPSPTGEPQIRPYEAMGGSSSSALDP